MSGLKKYRPDLPQPMPVAIRMLPVERGYPVPWFVQKVGDHYDFRIADFGKLSVAVKQKLCWICGQRLGKQFTFPLGPMCAVNRTSSEPPSHNACADWAARACPFLIQKEAGRRAAGLPEVVHPAGEMIMRQPGVVLLWRTESYSLFRDGRGGVLFRVGDPISVVWLREGREATRAEVEESISSGLPLLEEKCEGPDDRAALQQYLNEAAKLLPAGSNS